MALIRDDLGCLPLGPNAAYLVFQLISRCDQRDSVLITSNCPVMERGGSPLQNETKRRLPAERRPSYSRHDGKCEPLIQKRKRTTFVAHSLPSLPEHDPTHFVTVS